MDVFREPLRKNWRKMVILIVFVGSHWPTGTALRDNSGASMRLSSTRKMPLRVASWSKLLVALRTFILKAVYLQHQYLFKHLWKVRISTIRGVHSTVIN